MSKQVAPHFDADDNLTVIRRAFGAALIAALRPASTTGGRRCSAETERRSRP